MLLWPLLASSSPSSSAQIRPIRSIPLLLLLLLVLTLILGDGAANGQDTIDNEMPEDEFGEPDGARVEEPPPARSQAPSVTSLFGQVAKTVIYGGAVLAQANSHILCPLLRHETDKTNEDEPILFVFNNNVEREQAYRIYSDDDITDRMIEESGFDSRQMTIILVHGWLGGIHNELWLSEAKNAALENSFRLFRQTNWLDAGQRQLSRRNANGAPYFRPNVIIVEWSQFASGTLYEATQNSLKVSQRLARLIGQLARVANLRPELMHCLGHSIGTHICGQAARLAFPVQSATTGAIRPASQRFGRITGLDPGGFCYELGIFNETTFAGLRPSDALLVDAYYSNRSPFGNRFQVGQYNVRINNGYFQRPCSVWLDPKVASEYFRATIKVAFGNIGNNDVITCDHYFATRFARQLPPRTCSYVGYRCDSYRNFLRGKCGMCESPSQCYSMLFEYQSAQPSIEHALAHIRDHSSYFSPASSRIEPPGGVPYDERPVYYMRIPSDEPYCSLTFRVRVFLDRGAVDLRSFRADWLKLRFAGANAGNSSSSSSSSSSWLLIKDAASRSGSRRVDLLNLHGPWSATASNDTQAARAGIDERTLTGLFDLAPEQLGASVQRAGELLRAPIDTVQVEYNNLPNRHRTHLENPIEFIQLDYLSSIDPRYGTGLAAARAAAGV